MKTVINKIIAVICLTAVIASCKKDEEKVIANTSSSGALAASSNTLVLTKPNAANTAITFTVTNPDFGYSASVSNTLQLALKGTNFATPKEVSISSGATSVSYSVLDFNALLLSMGLPTSTNSVIQARIKSALSPNVFNYSNAIDLTVNPYTLISFLYVPGAYQGWNPATADSLISPTSNGIYEGIIRYTPSNLSFKVLTKKSWGTPEYGSGATAGTIAIGGGDLNAPAAGSTKVTVNLNTNTIEYSPLLWSIIGSAPVGSNWANDIEMVYDNGKQTWSVTTAMGVGAFKFRRNKDWAVNFGDKTGDLILDTENGNDINVTSAGNYRIVLNLVTNTYSITKL
jgi:starch-binding outer membrane protein SusE/F